jgi:hypothetical protein
MKGELKMQFYDIIEKKVMVGLNQVSRASIEEGWANDDSKWTQKIKEKLWTLGLNLGFEICSHNIGGIELIHGEWLYDMTWLEYDRRGKEGYLIDIPLVMESEWGKRDKVIDDFEKLLLARAKNKIMIFQMKNSDEINKMFDEFKKIILLFKRSDSLDRYLFAGLNYKENKFEFEVFMPFRNY